MSATAVTGSNFSEALMSSLKTAFPTWVVIDYADLFKRDFRDANVDKALASDVDQVLGLIDILHQQGAVDAEFHQDGGRRYYSRVRLTREGWSRVESAKASLVARVLEEPSRSK